MDIWSLILNPFITVLIFLYQILAENMVLAIIAFTIVVRLITHPLTIQQQRSSKAMQTLQPELKKIQEKYKDNPEKRTQAQMELYRKHGFNPMGGCLPLFIQLPIMLGLYQAIIMALGATPQQLLDLSGRILVPGLELLVPLENTFFGLNLAQPDPTLILPVLVLATSWLSQRMIMPSAQSGDDSQAAAMTRSMTTIMPIMFFFFALNFASGLSIYFVVSNVITMVQYTAMGRADIRNLFRRRGAAEDDEQPQGKRKAKANTSQAD